MSTDLRESAISGVGPTWRGQSLLPGIDHLSILERSRSALMIGGYKPDVADVLALVFTICAPWHSVFAASHTIADGRALLDFDDVSWRLSVLDWSRENNVTPDEIAEIRAGWDLIGEQIKACRWKTLASASSSSSRESGNSEAPSSARGMRLRSGLFLVAAAVIGFAAGFLLRPVFF